MFATSVRRRYSSHDPPIYDVDALDVEIVKRRVDIEVERTLKGAATGSERWNEQLASASEAIVKAERSGVKSVTEAQQITIAYAKSTISTEAV